ncbi:hypothetical protein [Streptomyces sp. NPDC004685]
MEQVQRQSYSPNPHLAHSLHHGPLWRLWWTTDCNPLPHASGYRVGTPPAGEASVPSVSGRAARCRGRQHHEHQQRRDGCGHTA